MTKIILILILVVTLYGLSAFIAPNVASQIDSVLGLSGLSESVRNGKDMFDSTITQIPTVEEFKSGAIEIGAKVQSGVTTTKETIDQIRSGAQKAENTYKEAKKSYDEVKNALSGATRQIEQVSQSIESFSSSSGSQTASGAQK